MATTPSQRGLGFPAVIEPRSFDLRSVQITVQQVRERLRVIDAALTVLQNATGANQLSATVAQLQQQVNLLQRRLTTVENSLGPDDTTTLIALTDMPAGAPVVPSGADSCRMVDPNDPEAVFACVGLVVSEVAQGQAAVIQRRGNFTLTGSGFEPGREVYASIGGDVTQQPTYGAAAVPVGVATSADTLYITTGSPALLALGLDDNAYERFMYASVELVSDAIALAAQVDAAANGLVTKTADGFVETRSLQGTTNRISVANGDGVVGNPTVDISASYAGQATIATLGTVTTGVWQATPVGIAFGGSGQSTANAALNAFLPSQPGHAGEALFTNGTDTAWGAVTTGTVTSVGVAGNDGIGVSGSPITSSGTITLSLGAITPLSVAAIGAVSGSNLSGTNTGDQTITLTGDVTGSGTGSFAATLATVNSNVGSFGSSTAIPTLTVNAKGLVTAVSTNAVVAPAGTLTGTTLAANVVSSSLTAVGTIGTGTWQGATVGVAYGGTGLSSGTSGGILGFTASGTLASSGVLTANALLLGGGAGATPSALGSLGTTTTVLHGNASGAPTFGAVSLTADVTGTLPVANGGTGITSLGAGVATWLGTPSSANLRTAVTDETGTGSLVFADTPTLVTPVIGAATGTSVNLSSTATASAFIPTGSGVPANGMYLPATNSIGLATNSTARMAVSSTGHIGFGETPPAWGAGVGLSLAANGGFLHAEPDVIRMGQNAYFNGVNWTRRATNATSLYVQVVGEHRWYNDASGSAGGTFAQTETLRLSSSALTFQTGVSQRNIDGSVGTPSISFSGDTDTGLYRVGSNALGFATGGALRTQVDSSGLGVGLAPTFASGSGVLVYDPGVVARLEMRNSATGSGTTNGMGLVLVNQQLQLFNRENSDVLIVTNLIASPQVTTFSAAGNWTMPGSLTTASSGSGAGAWKLGVAVAGAGLTLHTTSYVEIDIGGTVHKLAKVN